MITRANYIFYQYKEKQHISTISGDHIPKRVNWLIATGMEDYSHPKMEIRKKKKKRACICTQKKALRALIKWGI